MGSCRFLERGELLPLPFLFSTFLFVAKRVMLFGLLVSLLYVLILVVCTPATCAQNFRTFRGATLLIAAACPENAPT